MRLMRNREMIRICAAFALAALACGCICKTAAGAFFVLAAGGCCLWEASRHYREIRQLSEQMEELLFGAGRLDFSRFNEGDLSLLANTAAKLAVRMESERDVVRKDKAFLERSLADIAHQLRTPLSAMSIREGELLGLTDCGDEEQNARRIRLLGEIREQQRRLEWLAEGLLKLARLDSGTVKMDRKDIALKTLLQESAAPFEALMELKGQTLTVAADDETVWVDPRWMREALSNIVKNCVEHMDAGTLTLAGRLLPNYVLITIRDTGKGFAPKDIPHLFERFYRGENASPAGVGIGLSLAQEIIKAHGGRIEASNAEDCGAEFRVWLYRK